LDSGALYRGVAAVATESEIELDDEPALADLASALEFEFEAARGSAEIRLHLGPRDLSEIIRSEACGAVASRIAALPAVRAALLERQRAFRKAPGLIADGRDMGTVVFPDAELKIFLTASAEERAQRRYKQLKEKGNSVNLAQLFQDIAQRDRRDQQRRVSPLKPASDAVVIDTSSIGAQAVEARVLQLIRDSSLKISD